MGPGGTCLHCLPCWGREAVLLDGGVRVGDCAREKVGRKVGYAPDCSKAVGNNAAAMQRQCSDSAATEHNPRQCSLRWH